jgi:hypothetical protein
MSEEKQEPIIERKKMNMLQVMALVAMLLAFLTGDKPLFAAATTMMCVLKGISMALYEDSKEAFFAAVYGGFAIIFLFDL